MRLGTAVCRAPLLQRLQWARISGQHSLRLLFSAGNDDDPVLALTTARAALRPLPAGTDVFVQRVGGDTFFNGRRARVKSFQNGLYTVELKEGQKELLLEPEFVGDDTNLSDLVLPVSDPCNLRYMPPLTAIKCKSKLKG